MDEVYSADNPVLAERIADEPNRAPAKNVILFIGDGVIKGSELDRLRRQIKRNRAQRGRRDVDPVAGMDRGSDGRIALNEFDGVQGSLLDRTDFNGDGNIDRAEFMVARLRFRQRH